MKVDFHVHTRTSLDSLISHKNLMEKSKRLGIIPAITDHDSMDGVPLCKEHGECIAGEEVKTDKGDLIGLYLNEPIRGGTSFYDALDIIHEQGGLAYLPHMFDSHRAGAGVPDCPIDIIEAFNSRCLHADFNEKALEFSKAEDIPMAAGSDSHFLFEFGSTYTELPGFDIDDPKGLLAALEDAKLVCRNAPFYVRGPTGILKAFRSFFG